MVGSILFAIETKDEYMRNELAEEIRMFVAEEDANIVVKHCAEPLQGYMRHTVEVTMGAVSYTHLDVYKRQHNAFSASPGCKNWRKK